jgi:large subunit ribosomal protein L29
MKMDEMRSLTQVELESQLNNLRAEIFNLRFQQAARQLRNPARFTQVKREIARILTIMNERKARAAG